MCRLHYLRVSDPLPETVHEAAKYWKKHYAACWRMLNTLLGAGTESKYIEAYERYVLKG